MTHESVGAAATLAVCAAAGSKTLVAIGAVSVSVLGSRLPDVDQRGAQIHRRTCLERRSLIVRLVGQVLRLPVTVFAAVVKHRGTTHWLLSGVAVTIILAAMAGAMWRPLASPVVIGMGCGYLAYLIVDACTPRGTPLLGPFSVRRVHLLPSRLRMRTGDLGDSLMGLTAMLVTVALGLVVVQAA